MVAYPAARFGMGSGPIFLDQLQCSGSEQSLLDCLTFTDLGLHSCHHSMDAGVKCRGLLSEEQCTKALAEIARAVQLSFKDTLGFQCNFRDFGLSVHRGSLTPTSTMMVILLDPAMMA